MKLLISTLALVLSIILVDASAIHDRSLSARHARISRGETTLEIQVRAATTKRCKNRTNKAAQAANATTDAKPVAAPAAPPAPPKPAAPPAPAAGLIAVQGQNCGANGATKEITSISGPNGNINWINCGFESGGWRPPYVQMKDVITVPLNTALQSPGSPFHACGAYIGLFEKYGNMYGIPPIILASFAMQESSCLPWQVGQGGEQGLMQITKDKCGGAPNGDCKNPDFNIGQGARYFSQTLKDVGGNVFLAVGTYNGWKQGMTPGSAFAAANSACCRCQNNADYLMQFFNGWAQNISPGSRRLGKYFNLEKCPPW